MTDKTRRILSKLHVTILAIAMIAAFGASIFLVVSYFHDKDIVKDGAADVATSIKWKISPTLWGSSKMTDSDIEKALKKDFKSMSDQGLQVIANIHDSPPRAWFYSYNDNREVDPTMAYVIAACVWGGVILIFLLKKWLIWVLR